MPGVHGANGNSADFDEIQTPRSRGSLFANRTVLELAARIGVAALRKPVRWGKTVIVASHRDVIEVLRRDLDFRIAPVNAARIDAVNGPFVLGMDRSEVLTCERRALYSALSEVDLTIPMDRASLEAKRIIGVAESDRIDVVGAYARRVAGKTATSLFGISGSDEALFLEVARAIFAHTFLNLGGDKIVQARALKAAVFLRSWLEAEIARRRRTGETGADLMGALMRQKALDDDGVRRTLGGMLVGSIDTTATAVGKILIVMGSDRWLHDAARADRTDRVLLMGWCREALRRWPHNPLIERQTVADTMLNDVEIPAGCQVYVWTQAAMFDEEAFPEPRQMRPDRPSAAYLHFGGGLHPCAGRAVNDLQIPILVSEILARGIEHVGRIGWAGSFPAHVPVQLGKSQ